MPSVLVLTYSPDQGASVPAWRRTRNSSGLRRTRHSSSVVGRVVSFVAMLQRYVDGCRRTPSAVVAAATPVGPGMEDASPATFRPTCRQALGRGLYLGVVVAAVAVAAAVVVAPPGWVWPVLALGLPAAGALLGLAVGRCTGTEISAGGIRTLSVFADDVA